MALQQAPPCLKMRWGTAPVARSCACDASREDEYHVWTPSGGGQQQLSTARVFLLAGLALSLTGTATARAQAAPSNAELFQMIKTLQAKQADLKRQATSAKAEARSAKAELAHTKAQLRSVRSEVASPETVASEPAGLLTPSSASGPERDSGSREESFEGSSNAAVSVRHDDDPAWFGSVTGKVMMLGTDGTVLARSPVIVGGSQRSFFLGGDYGSGFEAALGYRFEHGTDITGRFSMFDYSETETATGNGQGSLIVPMWDGNGSYFENSVNGSIDLNLRHGDLEIGKSINLGPDIRVRLSGGGRLATIDRKIKLDNPILPGQFQQEARISHKILGAGPKLGATGALVLGPLTLEARGSASLLYARSNFTANFDSSIGDLSYREKQEFVLPVLDAEVAATWNFSIADAKGFISGGVQFQSWLDAIKHDVSNVSAQDFDHDLTLFGVFLRGGVELH